jgi:two-component system sensor histidine kinase AtoS
MVFGGFTLNPRWRRVLLALLALVCGGTYVRCFGRSRNQFLPDLGLDAGGGNPADAFHFLAERAPESDHPRSRNARAAAGAGHSAGILDAIRSGLVIIDPAGKVTAINRAGCAVLGLARAALLDQPVAAAFAAQPEFRSILETALAARQRCQEYELAVTDGGRERWLAIHATPLRDRDGRMAGWAVTFEDITEVRELRQRVAAAEKLAVMGELAAGIAHEVRNPLGAIRTSAQFLQDRTEPGDIAFRFPQLIIREVDRLEHLVGRLLKFARPAERAFQSADLHRLLEESLELAALKNGIGQIRFEKIFCPEAPRLFADAERLQQAFLNILLNAIDAMDGAGRITIQTAYQPERRQLRIEFSDSGAGIPPQRLSRIFDPFFTTRPQGTGLGLAIVRQIIAEHQGAIEVQSELGLGTTFVITLPVAISEAPARPRSAEQSS